MNILLLIFVALERERCGEHTVVDFRGVGKGWMGEVNILSWIVLVAKTQGRREHPLVHCLGGGEAEVR